MDKLSFWNDDIFDFPSLFPYKRREIEMDKSNKSFKVAVPGFGKEDLSAKINDEGHLIISGDNGESKFERLFRIPGVGVNSELELTCSKGVLTIKLPEKNQKELLIE